MTYDKSIFDHKDLPMSIRNDLHLISQCDKFREKICRLFDVAKEYGINELNVNQVTVAYYRIYTAKDKKDIKTLQQIRTKMYNIVRDDARYKKKFPDSNFRVLQKIPHKGVYFFE